MSNKKRLYVSVVKQLSSLINSGEFLPGSRLPTERELSERFKVSRPTIREAIIALEAKKQVSVKANSGVYVLNHPGATDIMGGEFSAFELLEARVLIEGEAAALAARMISPDEQLELKKALSKIEREGVEDISSSGADRQFHAVIARATHNRVIARQIKDLWDIQENFNHIYDAHLSVCKEDASTRVTDHIAIYEAITEGSSAKARQAMHRHFSDLLEAMHDASERQAVEATKQKSSQLRERFKIEEPKSVSR